MWSRTIGLLACLWGIVLVVGWFGADYHYAEGRLYAEAGYIAAAVEHLEKAVQWWPWEPAYHRELARAYLRLLPVVNDSEQALVIDWSAQHLEKALQLNPQNMITLKTVIPAFWSLAKIDENYRARVIFLVEHAVKLCPTDPVLWYLQGVVLADSQPDLAQLSFGKALSLKPDYEKAFRELERL